ncbi:MAG: amidase domain-containing protein [Limnochordia bacterium]|jgi:hypothetical protein
MRVTFNRAAAVRYALRHVFHPNPAYANMDTMGGGGDCTNFTSQCLHAGGWTMDYRAVGYDTEWWYRRLGDDSFDGNNDDWWSCTWSLPSLLIRYLTINYGGALDLLRRPRLARNLRRGDLVFYDWNGDGLFDHSAIVTRTANGVPRVTYRTLSPLRPIRNAHWRLRFRRKAQAIVGVRLPSRPDRPTAMPNWLTLVPCDQARKREERATQSAQQASAETPEE